MISIMLPGSLWPRDAGAEPYAGLHAPTLARALRDVEVSPVTATCWSSLLADSLSDALCDAPFAVCAARALGHADGASNITWFRADPAHFEVGREDVALATPAGFSLNADEAQTLIAALNTHFAPDGVSFFAPSARQWLMRCETTVGVQTVDPWAAHLVPARFLPVQGAGASLLRKIQTEVQMLLHEHPVNLAREARGEASVNSLWFWASGRDFAWPPRANVAVITDCIQATSLSQALGMPCFSREAMIENPQSNLGSVIAYFPRLIAPMMQGDGAQWRARLSGEIEPMLATRLAGDTPVEFVFGAQRPTHRVRVKRGGRGVFDRIKAAFASDDAALALHRIGEREH